MRKLQIVFGVIVGILTVLGLFDIVEFPSYIQIPFVSMFVAVWLFTAGIHAKQMYERGALDRFLSWMYAPLVVAVILVDVIFNAVWGSIVFREVAREWLFTNRVKRHYYKWANLDESQPHFKTASKWRHRLNAIDPGHV